LLQGSIMYGQYIVRTLPILIIQKSKGDSDV